MFFLIILLLILIAYLSYMYYNYENKIFHLKNQLSLSNSINMKLKKELSKDKKKYANITLKFSNAEISKGILNQDSSLFLCPIDISPILKDVKENTKVKIHCIVENGDNLWYEVLLISENIDDNINCQGWIPENVINLINIEEEKVSDGV